MFFIPYGVAFTIRDYPVIPQGGGDTYQASPTYAAGDVQVSVDGGAYANVSSASSGTKGITINLSAAQCTGKEIKIRLSDAAGAQWRDDHIILYTVGHASAQLPNVNVQYASAGDSMALTAAAVTAIWEKVLDGTLTAQGIMKLAAAMFAGKATYTDNGDGTYTIVFRDPADTKNRITLTISTVYGDRSATATDVT